jgi:hypothetical protein
MAAADFTEVPEPLREAARSALGAAGAGRVTALRPVTGGASGALTWRADAGGRSYLLRMETGQNALQNPHHYTCMKAAADAGIAPPLHFVDPERGVAVMDFVTQRPLGEFPGGPPALAGEMGRLVRRLQDSAVFPAPAILYRDLVTRMFAFVCRSKVFAPGLLDAHAAGFERIREVYPWADAARVASNNDPNPRNVLFDGERLWLVDWELACANDSLADVAIVTHELAGTPELQEVLLRAWLGREPDRETRARLALMRQITRIFFASVLLRYFAADPDREPDPSVESLTPEQFVAAIQSGRLRLGTPQVLYEFGKMFLAGFLAGLGAPDFEESLATLAR